MSNTYQIIKVTKFEENNFFVDIEFLKTQENQNQIPQLTGVITEVMNTEEIS